MKNQETRPADGNQKAHGAGNGDGLVLTCDHRDTSFEHWPRPTELELAHLAARLARTEKLDPKQLVSEAWALYWESCRKIQLDHREVTKMLRTLETQDDELSCEQSDTLPKPSAFPVEFQEVERLLLPKLKGRTGERAVVIREYMLAELLKHSFVIRPEFRATSYWEFDADDLANLREKFRDEITRKFAELRKTSYDSKAYTQFATSFLAWHHQWTGHRRSQTKSANARKGWDKRRDEKKAKTGARPKKKVLKAILDGPAPKTSKPGA